MREAVSVFVYAYVHVSIRVRKVRNRVDRRLYAVKKVGLDPFDRETNRKIRREVTTISTLIHKNIVRYFVLR